MDITKDAPKDFEKHFREKYKLGDDNFGYYHSDLHVRGTNDAMTNHIFDEITSWGFKSHRMFHSQNTDQSWYGKLMIDIPFARMDIILENKAIAAQENLAIEHFLRWLDYKEQIVFFREEFPGSPTMEKLTLMDMFRLKVKFTERERK